jgi:YbbR domain-containing protein
MILERIKENWQYRAIALILAIFSWYLVAGREKVQTWIELPVELINQSPDLVIQEGMVNRIEVLIRGTRGSVRTIKDRQIAYSLNLSGLNRGENEIYFQPQFIPLPGAVEVMEIRPQRMSLIADRRVSKQLPVKVSWKGQIDPDWEMIRAVTQPAYVTVRGPAALVDVLTFMPTRTFELEMDESGMWQRTVPLSVDSSIEADPAQVTARLFFKPKSNSLWVKVPVSVKSPDRMKIDLPEPEIRLHLDVPAFLLRRDDWREEIAAQVTVRKEVQPGTYELDPEISLPKWTQLLKINPEKVQVTVVSN